MSTCIDTANGYDNLNSNYEPAPNTEYVRTILEKCLYCSHMPYGVNRTCSMILTDQLYCLANNYCYFIQNRDVEIYVSNVKIEEFIEDDEFEV